MLIHKHEGAIKEDFNYFIKKNKTVHQMKPS